MFAATAFEFWKAKQRKEDHDPVVRSQSGIKEMAGTIGAQKDVPLRLQRETATFVQVSDTIWLDAVRAVVDVCAFVIVDVTADATIASEVWEYLGTTKKGKVILAVPEGVELSSKLVEAVDAKIIRYPVRAFHREELVGQIRTLLATLRSNKIDVGSATSSAGLEL